MTWLRVICVSPWNGSGGVPVPEPADSAQSAKADGAYLLGLDACGVTASP